MVLRVNSDCVHEFLLPELWKLCTLIIELRVGGPGARFTHCTVSLTCYRICSILGLSIVTLEEMHMSTNDI